MKAMILAAGLGTRMRPLTDTIPKPLLEVKGKPLIVWHIEHLVEAGFEEIIINVAHLGYKIIDYIAEGSRYGAKVSYSDEQEEGALESAGGIVKALPLLGSEPFLVVNADIWTDFNFDPNIDLGENLAHLILVDNPEHNMNGDFSISNGLLKSQGDRKYTFSGIGYYSPKMFHDLKYGKSALAPLLRGYMDKGLIGGELYKGIWSDVGTPERLAILNG